MRVHPQKVVARLTPTAKRLLEHAVGIAVQGQQAELTPEHVLLAMIDERGGDTEMLLRVLEVDPRRVRGEIERAVRDLRGGSSARPRLSDAFSRWLEDAWVYASLERGETALRSGALLAQLVIGSQRYLSEPLGSLASIGADAMRSAADEALASTPERGEASPRAATPAEGGPAMGASSAALARFTTSFCEAARSGRIDPVFGREREVRQVIDVLCRRRKNNPILVGEPGVGKTALVEGLALAIVRGEVPEPLRGVDVRALDLGALEAGASVKGEFESRLRAVITEVQTAPAPIVLFIDEAHTIIGAGNAKGGADAANLLKPALARGELRTIAATTWAEFKQYFEKDAALERRFQPVVVEEPSEDVAIGMLRGLRPIYERAHQVIVRDEAIRAAVELGHRYITGRQLPDKAVDLLDTTAARVRVERSGRPSRLVAVEAELASLAREREALERDLRDVSDPKMKEALERAHRRATELEGARSELVAAWNAQRDALERALAARTALHDNADGARTEALEREAAATFDALRSLAGEAPLVAIDVDAGAIARTIEQWTGVPIGAQRQSTQRAVLTLSDQLKTRVLGQDAALDRIAESLRVAQAGLRSPDAPLGVFLLVGPSGVGKTETAHAIADLLFGGDRFLTTINLSEYQEPHTATRLIGSPPSFVGYGEGGELTEAVRQRPYSVVLLDECEKAALEVMNTFYQVFDRGILNDAEGRTINFRNTCILLTSNLASDEVCRAFGEGRSIDEVIEIISPRLSRHFKPALLHRMTVVPYAPITPVTLRRIVGLEIDRLSRRMLAVHGASLSVSEQAQDEIVARCTLVEGGVRFLRQILERAILIPLSTELLTRAAPIESIAVGMNEGAIAFELRERRAEGSAS